MACCNYESTTGKYIMMKVKCPVMYIVGNIYPCDQILDLETNSLTKLELKFPGEKRQSDNWAE